MTRNRGLGVGVGLALWAAWMVSAGAAVADSDSAYGEIQDRPEVTRVDWMGDEGRTMLFVWMDPEKHDPIAFGREYCGVLRAHGANSVERVRLMQGPRFAKDGSYEIVKTVRCE